MVYRETSQKDILFECTFRIEEETGDIYIWEGEEWKLITSGALKGLNLPNEPEAILKYDNEIYGENGDFDVTAKNVLTL